MDTKIISYKDIVKATKGFSSENLLVQYPSEMFKRAPWSLRHGGPTSFMEECEALKNIRHRNLIKSSTYVPPSLDPKGPGSLASHVRISQIVNLMQSLSFVNTLADCNYGYMPVSNPNQWQQARTVHEWWKNTTTLRGVPLKALRTLTLLSGMGDLERKKS
uniref:Serine-threonine/tyrosine-protein kinase catalytic domain-containing protein n=1 Tax=Oryza barthii TaxID=65489 RepID=A0A0D3F2B2_9ORYZ